MNLTFGFHRSSHVPPDCLKLFAPLPRRVNESPSNWQGLFCSGNSRSLRGGGLSRRATTPTFCLAVAVQSPAKHCRPDGGLKVGFDQFGSHIGPTRTSNID